MADSVSYEYDLNGRLKKLTFGNADEYTVSYDDMGNREETDMTLAAPLLAAKTSPAGNQTAQEVTSGTKQDDASENKEQ